MPPEYFWWWPMWMFPLLMPVVILTVLIIALYLIFGRGARLPWEPPGGREAESALDILKKRYARGEITKEEFEQMKKDIM